MNCKVQ